MVLSFDIILDDAEYALSLSPALEIQNYRFSWES